MGAEGIAYMSGGGYSGATAGWRIITGRSSLMSLLLAFVSVVVNSGASPTPTSRYP